MHFFYDAQGRPSVVKYGSSWYSYVYNLQGDVVRLLDSNNNMVVEYTYDAWGKPISVSGSAAASLGALNPFRYRGYAYDEETGLYYLKTRYYNPVWGRFVCADTLISQERCNLYCYCMNHPDTSADQDGRETYNVVLNIYESKNEGGKGHFDFCIYPDSGEGLVSFSIGNGEKVEGNGILFSYDEDPKIRKRGIMKVVPAPSQDELISFGGRSFKSVTRYTICWNITDDELDVFWKSFFQCSFATYDDNNLWCVIDSDYCKYDGTDYSKSYCGAVAAYLIEHIRFISNNAIFNPNWASGIDEEDSVADSLLYRSMKVNQESLRYFERLRITCW